MFILVMIMTVILVFVMTRRESYNPWLPWNWFRKPEPPRSTPERPRSTPERPYPRSTPERPRPMPERPRPRPMPERPYPMPERPRPRPMDPRLALIPEHKMRPPDASGLIFFNRPAQPLSPGVRARMEPR
jgi:hypothetical protein